MSHPLTSEASAPGPVLPDGTSATGSATAGAPRARATDPAAAGELQRTRIMNALLLVTAERGLAETTVSAVIAQAGVSRRAFYAYFEDLDDAVVEVMDATLRHVSELASHALTSEPGPWRDRLRAALASVLAFFDSEPRLARLCFVESLRGGPLVLSQRARIVAAFRMLVVGLIEPELSHVSPLTAESVLASILGVIHTRLISPRPEPLLDLVGPLMGTIATLSRLDPDLAREEARRAEDLAKVFLADRSAEPRVALANATEIPPPLREPRAFRARMCLLFVVAQGRAGARPNNREIGDAIGVRHRGQVSTVLALLLRLELLSKEDGKPGRPHAWRATAHGERVADTLSEPARGRNAS